MPTYRPNAPRGYNLKHVDFFSLDVEGAEKAVLDTMDWGISVSVFLIETGRGQERDAALKALLREHGYSKAAWDITTACQVKCRFDSGCEQRSCVRENEVFEHEKWKDGTFFQGKLVAPDTGRLESHRR